MITLEQAITLKQAIDGDQAERNSQQYAEAAPVLVERFNRVFQLNGNHRATIHNVIPARYGNTKVPAIRLDDDHYLTFSAATWLMHVDCPVCGGCEEREVYDLEKLVDLWTSTPTQRVMDPDDGEWYYPWKCKSCEHKQQRKQHPVWQAIEREDGDHPTGSYGKAIALAMYYMMRNWEDSLPY